VFLLRFIWDRLHELGNTPIKDSLFMSVTSFHERAQTPKEGVRT